MSTQESRPDYVRDIATLRITDADDAGGKGANLGELVAAELPVPPGFVLMRACYLDTMREGGIDEELNATHRTAMGSAADGSELTELSHRMQSLVYKAGVSDAVRARVLDAYRGWGPMPLSRSGPRQPARTAPTHRSRE